MNLTELMIGLLLASLAAVGALTAFSQGRSRYDVSQALNRLQERATYVFSALEPELQLAGYYGVHGAALLPPATAPASAEACGPGLTTRLGVPVEAQATYSLDCAAHTSGAMPGSAVLILRRASAQPGAPDPGRMQVLTSLDDARARAVLTDGTLPGGAHLEAGLTELRDLVVRCWYVARESDGDDHQPALRVKSLTRVAGQPRFVDTEVMPGVEGLDVELGLRDASAPDGVRFIASGTPAGGAQAVAVRVTLRLRATETALRARRLTVTRSFALRNAESA